MSNNVRKSSLEQAKADFEEIRIFAQQQIESKLQEEVDKKILEVINEEVNISIDDEGNVDITKDGEEVATVNASEEFTDEEGDGVIEVSDDEEPIEVSNEEQTNENMLEMNRMTNEAEVAAASAPVAPAAETTTATAPVPEAPVVEEPVAEEPVADDLEGGIKELVDSNKELISKLEVFVNAVMQQQGISTDQEAGEQEFEVVDDEAEVAPAPAAEVPATEVPAAPVQEEMTFEIEEFEEGHDLLEIIDEELEEATEETLEIVDEDEMPQEGWGSSMEEMHGVGHNFRHSNKLGKQPRQGVEHRLQENKEIKAQYESKLG
jgi:hypothetical protein